MRPGIFGSEDMKGLKVKQVSTPFSEEEVERIDDVRFGNRLNSRAETIRFLVKKGLERVADEDAVKA